MSAQRDLHDLFQDGEVFGLSVLPIAVVLFADVIVALSCSNVCR